MKDIISCVDNVRGKGSIKSLVDMRSKEFKDMQKQSDTEIFKELCFCILTANFQAEKSIQIQNDVGDGFLYMTKKMLAKRLKQSGHRFPNARAKYIVEARKHAKTIKQTLFSMDCDNKRREWLVKNIKGLGYKEASHFLRNIGFTNVAIIDFHIVDFLVGYNAIDKPKSMTKLKYLEIENVLKRISAASGTTLGDLDLYLWYCETGKVLK